MGCCRVYWVCIFPFVKTYSLQWETFKHWCGLQNNVSKENIDRLEQLKIYAVPFLGFPLYQTLFYQYSHYHHSYPELFSSLTTISEQILWYISGMLCSRTFYNRILFHSLNSFFLGIFLPLLIKSGWTREESLQYNDLSEFKVKDTRHCIIVLMQAFLSNVY